MEKRFEGGEEGVLERIRSAFAAGVKAESKTRNKGKTQVQTANLGHPPWLNAFVSAGMGDDAALVRSGRQARGDFDVRLVSGGDAFSAGQAPGGFGGLEVPGAGG